MSLRSTLKATQKQMHLHSSCPNGNRRESDVWCSRNTPHLCILDTLREAPEKNESWIKASELNWATPWHVRWQLLTIYTFSILHMLQVQNDSLFIWGRFLHCIVTRTIGILFPMPFCMTTLGSLHGMPVEGCKISVSCTVYTIRRWRWALLVAWHPILWFCNTCSNNLVLFRTEKSATVSYLGNFSTCGSKEHVEHTTTVSIYLTSTSLKTFSGVC